MASTPTHWITMGLHTDLLEASKMAVRKAIKFLNKYYGIPDMEGYAFCSMAVDLHVTQVVDYALGIHAMIPKSVFVGKQYAGKNTLLLKKVWILLLPYFKIKIGACQIAPLAGILKYAQF